MSTLEYKLFYRRHLPHIQPPGATLFVTFRLAGSIPAEVLQQLRAEAERVEAILACIPDPQKRAERAYLEQRRLFGNTIPPSLITAEANVGILQHNVSAGHRLVRYRPLSLDDRLDVSMQVGDKMVAAVVDLGVLGNVQQDIAAKA
jgi:hypothetical protein